jgi:hypothetical protein
MSDFNTKVELFIGLTSQNGVAFYPEWAIQEVIDPALSRCGFDGFSVTLNTGYWRGVAEQSLTVTVFCNDSEWAKEVARQIAIRLDQEAVLVNIQAVSANFIR